MEEQVVKMEIQVMSPCKYFSMGCEATLPDSEKTGHEESCEFRPYSCPCPGSSCKWHGSLEQVVPHLRQRHKSIITLPGEDIVFMATDINRPGSADWIMLQTCFGHHFLVVLEKWMTRRKPIYYSIVLLIGTRKQAESFVYRMELNGVRRRLTWEAPPRSIHDSIQSAFRMNDCLVFDTQHFAKDGNLSINVTINMC